MSDRLASRTGFGSASDWSTTQPNWRWVQPRRLSVSSAPGGDSGSNRCTRSSISPRRLPIPRTQRFGSGNLASTASVARGDDESQLVRPRRKRSRPSQSQRGKATRGWVASACRFLLRTDARAGGSVSGQWVIPAGRRQDTPCHSLLTFTDTGIGKSFASNTVTVALHSSLTSRARFPMEKHRWKRTCC